MSLSQYFNEQIKPLNDELGDMLNLPTVYEELAYEVCEYDGGLMQLEDIYFVEGEQVCFHSATCREAYLAEQFLTEGGQL